jgi:hypothetical protein
MLLDAKVARLAGALREAGIPHAFGGAIALAYYATPRGTRDIDINVFLPVSGFDRVLEALLPLGIDAPNRAMRRSLERDERVRLVWDGTPLDLFFSYSELHEACVERTRIVPFGDERIAILGAEDLAIFKALFARDKDWRDLREMLAFQVGFDAAYAIDWLARILSPDDERLTRFRALVAERRRASASSS